MSHILKTNDDLILLRDIVKYISNHNPNKDFIEEVLNVLISNEINQKLISYQIMEKGRITAMVTPKDVCIKASSDKVNIWLENNIKSFEENEEIKDFNTLKSFLFLFLIIHEIEHAYQFLMGEERYPSPNKMIQEGYKGISGLFIREESIIPRPIKEMRRFLSLILYNKKANYLILERNANIEASDLLSSLALFMGRDDMFKIFNHLKNSFMCIGYMDDSKGSLEETYQTILMYSKYKKFYEELDISEEERTRYGLRINESTRQKILQNLKK